MQHTSAENLLALAKQYYQHNTPWHHHYLPPKCAFNQTIAYRISLENEETGEAWYADFDAEPLELLRELEALFFHK